MGRRLLKIRRRLRAWLIVAGLALAALLAVGGIVSTALTAAAPAWWRHYRLSDVLQDHGAAVENAAVTHLYKQRPPDPAWVGEPTGPWRSGVWSIALKEEDASAWLTARLPAWIDGHADMPEWPTTLGRPQVRFEDGLIRLGVTIHRERGDRIVSADFRPEIRPDGSVWLRTKWVHLGRLPVPSGLVLGEATQRLRDRLPKSLADDPHAARLAGILAGDLPLAEEPVMHLEDGRAVRLLGLRVLEGRVEIDLRTEIENALAKN